MLTTALLALVLGQAEAQEIKEYNAPDATYERLDDPRGYDSLALSPDGKLLAAGGWSDGCRL
jgi:hypothetical protein